MNENSEQRKNNENKSGLLDGVKSNLILKSIFTNLTRRKKLKIVSYNKKLQNEFKLNLYDYAEQSKYEKCLNV